MSEALSAALKALARREHAEAEVRDLLVQRGFEEGEITGAMERLREEGLVDDARFARAFAEDKRALSGWGEERIRGALEGRGVDSIHIETALAAEDQDSQLQRAAKLARSHLPQRCRDGDRRRVLGFLVRRGYPLELAYEAIRRAERGG